MTTTPYPRTRLGLKVMNFTRYNTDDIVAMLEWAENSIPDVIIQDDFKAGMSLREMGYSKDPDRPKVRRGYGVRRGAILIASPKDIYDNALEALAAEGSDSVSIPQTGIRKLLSLLRWGVYSTADNKWLDDEENDIVDSPNVPHFTVRIEKKRQNKVIRDGKSAQRTAARKQLKTLEFKLTGMKRSLKSPSWRVTKRARRAGQAAPAPDWKSVEAVTGTDSYKKAVEKLSARMTSLRADIRKAVDAIRLPEFTQEEE